MIISNLEQLSNWQQPGNVGNSGGGSTQPHGTFLMTPAVPGQFSAKPASPYDNGYFYTVLPFGAFTYFIYRLSFMFPTLADLAAAQAVEFELQQNVGGRIYNMAWQADIKGSGYWRVFDYINSVWVPTPISVFFLAGEWTDVEATFLRGADNSLTHLSLTLNGKQTAVNVRRMSTPKVETDYVHAAFQLDTESTALPYRVEVRGMSVEML